MDLLVRHRGLARGSRRGDIDVGGERHVQPGFVDFSANAVGGVVRGIVHDGAISVTTTTATSSN